VYNATFETIVVVNATKQAIIARIITIENGQRERTYELKELECRKYKEHRKGLCRKWEAYSFPFSLHSLADGIALRCCGVCTSVSSTETNYIAHHFID